MAELNEERSKVDRDSESCQYRAWHPPTLLLTSSSSVRNCMAARRESLRKRRELLEQAQQLHKQDLTQEARTEETIAEERYVSDLPAIFRAC